MQFINNHFTTSAAFHRIALLFLAFAVVSDAEAVLGQEDAAKPSGDGDDGVVGLMDPVFRLNRFTFEQTILEEHADEVPHWIVLFCPPWFEPCQALEPVFRELTQKWQDQLNNAVLSTEVRFAAVDCATEKALCNTQNVVTYPFVAHYRNRKQVKVWRGKSFETDQQRLRDFLQKELGPVAATMSTQLDNEDLTPEGVQSVPVDFLLIFAAIAGNAYFISRGGFGSEATPSSDLCAKQPGGGRVQQVGHRPAESAHIPTSIPKVDHQASCVVRSLPKEWGLDRPSLEL